MASLPSLLLLLPDDFPRNLLGTYGASHGLTPSIDKLAARGITLHNVYTTSPLCTPSRYSLLTGTYASTALNSWRARNSSGVRQIRFNTWLQGQANATIAGRLRKHGYTTGFLGKWHVANTDGREDGKEMPQHHQQEVVRQEGGFEYADDVYLANPSILSYAHNPEWMAHLAMRFMKQAEKHPHKPYFLFVAPTLPHEPLDNIAEQLARAPRAGPPGYTPLQHDEEQQLFSTWGRTLRAHVSTAMVKSRILCPTGNDASNLTVCSAKKVMSLSAMIGPAPWLPTDLSAREVAHVLCGSAWLDATLAPVIEQANADGRRGGVLIIFSSDHGPGWAGKGHPYEAGIRVPLILQPPAHWFMTTPQHHRKPITHLDVLPMLESLAALQTASSETVSGRKYEGVLLRRIATSSPETVYNSTVFVEIGVARAILTGEWKLIVISHPSLAPNAGCISFQGTRMSDYIDSFRRGDNKPKMSLIYDGYRHHSDSYCDRVQLYHLSTDPGERVNVARTRPDVVNDLGTRLASFVKSTEPSVQLDFLSLD